ncbi:MAG TPA: Lrp/AsnC family transcriptional regulator [Geodermatophilus sp.]|nr:Lrp/AsnC family transcriptional regulator [Geodermatophilus sp.]
MCRYGVWKRNTPRLDRVDRDILFHLERDGRLSNVELASRVGLTPPPCLRRVKRLEAEGVIAGYRAVIDPRAAGRAFEVIVAFDIAANDRRTVEEFEAAVVAFDEVISVRRLFGKPDYFVQVAVADAEAFEAFQMSKLIGLPAVSRAVSHQTMKRLKG